MRIVLLNHRFFPPHQRGRAQGVELEIGQVLHVVRRALQGQFSHRPLGFVVHFGWDLANPRATRGGSQNEPVVTVTVVETGEGHGAVAAGFAAHGQREDSRPPRD